MGNNSHLTVYKASAGSGKTFRLAVQYITMLVRHPEDYRTILAVTFTNKATAEMKQRILSQLYGIGHSLNSSQPYFFEVKNAVNLNEQTIRHNALLALDMILQDYSSFRVETIDSFFQTVLRGLARELGIGGNLTLELDTDAAIDEAVDAFLANVQPDTPDKRNIMKFVESKIENDKNWSIDKTVKDFSKELFSEIFMQNGQELRRIMTDNPDAVTDYKENLVTARDSALSPMEQEVLRIGQEIDSVLSNAAFSVDGLSDKPRNEARKIINGAILEKELTSSFIRCIDEPDFFFTAPVKKKRPELVNLAAEQLCHRFARVQDIHDRYISAKNSFDAALKYLHELSLLLSIRREIDAQSQEQGRFLLADTPQLLHQMEEGDTSFVFEKTGSFTRHVMIDEFQDTSDLQWRNLALLLDECLSTNNDCLVVGDVKQSIYRWRNSDWNILNTGIETEFARYNPTVVTMGENRRSRAQIIEFNNKLFPMAVELTNQFYKEKTGLEYPNLGLAYKSVEQQCIHNDGTGYVYAQIITKEIKAKYLADTICPKIADQLDQLTAAGVLPTDIAILCRKKDQIADIANWFALNRPDYNMISGEAFQLDSSVAVRIMVNAMRWLSDSTDCIALAQLAWEYTNAINGTEITFDRVKTDGFENALPKTFREQADSLRHLPLYELTEKLYTILDLGRIEGQAQYIMAFQDTVCLWLSRNPGDMAQFIQDWDDDLHKTPIPAPDINGIRLLTIHKSKGLEFHTVIVPMCNWPIIDSGGYNEKRLWIKPGQEPYDKMPIIPVGFNNTLAGSAFEEHYKTEAGLQTVDNLNLLYVALTRAISNLIILSSRPHNKGSIYDILEACMSMAFQSEADNDTITYRTGRICPHTERKNTDSRNPFDAKPTVSQLSMHTYPINARFRQSGESTRFVHSDDEDIHLQEEYIKTGNLMHSLFATIRTEADIDPQIDQMLRDGLLDSAHKADKLKQDIRKHIASTLGAKEWFNGNYALFNEASIIYRDGGILQTRRPDRVMIKPDGRVIIVDFKFGREKEEYMHQVQEYMDLLRKMGHPQVEGHIWYVYSNKITDCNN
ncbi:MAG: UvrD-helicase domain-containing protein [Bacteroidaceae bacterium]|nr:UvrD-helicase domain-containing protein [Bacteroidaceae bacterium]